MTRWYEQYVGKPWAGRPTPPDSYNCAVLVTSVYKDILGIDLLNIENDGEKQYECLKTFKKAVENHLMFGLKPISQNEAHNDFDIVFLARNNFDDHCGVLVNTSDGVLCLHCLQSAGVVLEDNTTVWGRGFNKSKIFRHDKCLPLDLFRG
jgi:hypothetical protein